MLRVVELVVWQITTLMLCMMMKVQQEEVYFDAFENMGGTLNEDVSANGNNYSANSFKDSYRGALSIKVNGVEKHEVTL